MQHPVTNPPRLKPLAPFSRQRWLSVHKITAKTVTLRDLVKSATGKKDNLYSTGISMDILSQLAERIEAKQVLFVIDACFSGNIGQIISKTGIYPEETKKEIENFIKNKGRDVLTAGTMDEEAVMGDKWENHSVYTYYLLKGLRGGADYNRNKVITLTELQLYLETLVPKDAKQTPQRITLDSSRGGQFVFYWEGEE